MEGIQGLAGINGFPATHIITSPAHFRTTCGSVDGSIVHMCGLIGNICEFAREALVHHHEKAFDLAVGRVGLELGRRIVLISVEAPIIIKIPKCNARVIDSMIGHINEEDVLLGIERRAKTLDLTTNGRQSCTAC